MDSGGGASLVNTAPGAPLYEQVINVAALLFGIGLCLLLATIGARAACNSVANIKVAGVSPLEVCANINFLSGKWGRRALHVWLGVADHVMAPCLLCADQQVCGWQLLQTCVEITNTRASLTLACTTPTHASACA